MLRIKNYFSNFDFADEDKNRKNHILYTLWLSDWIFFTVLLIIGFFLSKNFIGVLIFYIITSISLLLVGLLRLFKYLDQASIVFIGFNWVLISMFAYVSGGYLTIISSFFIALIVITGVLINYKGSLFVLLATLTSALIYIFLNQNSAFPVLFFANDINNWFIFLFIGILVIVPIYLNLKSLNSSLNKYKDLSDSLDKVVRERTKELEESNKDLKSFTYAISHELKTPLNFINSSIDLVKENLTELQSNELQDIIIKIQNNSHQMTKLFDDLLNFFQLTKQPIVKTPVDMNSLVNKALESFEQEIKQRNVELKRGELSQCTGDENLLLQVWINLISNALKYTSNKKNPTIEIFQKTRDKECLYYIKDNGIGFEMEKATKLFNEFQRLNNSFEGNGLGLALCKRILTGHGGEIYYESKIDKGSTFYFTIPK